MIADTSFKGMSGAIPPWWLIAHPTPEIWLIRADLPHFRIYGTPHSALNTRQPAA